MKINLEFTIYRIYLYYTLIIVVIVKNIERDSSDYHYDNQIVNKIWFE